MTEWAKAGKFQAEKDEGKQKKHPEDDWAPPPPLPTSSPRTTMVTLGPQNEGPSKRPRLELVLIATLFYRVRT